MTDDDFEDILDQVHYYFPLRGDRFDGAEYEKLVARVVNTGGEEQRAQLQELIDGLGEEAERDRAAEEDAADAAREEAEQGARDAGEHEGSQP